MKDAFTSEDRLDAIDPKPIKYNWEFVLNKKWDQLLDWWEEEGVWPMFRRNMIRAVLILTPFAFALLVSG